MMAKSAVRGPAPVAKAHRAGTPVPPSASRTSVANTARSVSLLMPEAATTTGTSTFRVVGRGQQQGEDGRAGLDVDVAEPWQVLVEEGFQRETPSVAVMPIEFTLSWIEYGEGVRGRLSMALSDGEFAPHSAEAIPSQCVVPMDDAGFNRGIGCDLVVKDCCVLENPTHQLSRVSLFGRKPADFRSTRITGWVPTW